MTQGDGANDAPPDAPPLPSSHAGPLPMPPLPPLPPRVEITFDYTFDEICDGLTSSPDEPQRQPKRRPLAKRVRLIGWVLLIALAVVLLMFLNRGEQPRVDLLMAAGPSVLAASLVTLGIVIVTGTFWMAMSPNQKTRDAGGGLQTPAVVGMVLIAIAALGMMWARGEPSGCTVRYRTAMTVALLPWFFVIVLTFTAWLWLSSSDLRLKWLAQSARRRPRTIVLVADWVRWRDEVSDLLYRWPYFRRAWETPNVLVMEDENELRHILPKRVMDPATLDQARSIIASHLADARLLIRPGGIPAALPARPPESSGPPAAGG